MNYKSIISSYHLLDIARIQLYEEVEDIFLNEPVLKNISVIETGKAYWNGKVLHFIVPEIIPHNKLSANKEWYKKQLWHWVGIINNAFKKLENNSIKFNKVLCYIKMFMPAIGPWDIDNRCYSIVINGIKYTRVIDDDSFNHMVILLSGDTDQETPRTEIYLTEYSNFAPYIDSYFFGKKY